MQNVPRFQQSNIPAVLAAVILLAGLSACSLPDGDEWKRPHEHGDQATNSSRSHSDAQATAIYAAPARIDALMSQKTLLFKPCLEQSLRHNLKVQVAKLGAVASSQGEKIAQAAFDPVIKFNGITYPDVGTGWDNKEGNVMIKKKFITGTELRAEAGSAFTNNTDRGLDYMPNGTQQVIRLTQPLLRGAGIDINRAPLDLARIVTANAGAMARAEVMEMLRATETGYWTVVWAKEALHVEQDSLSRSRQMVQEVDARRNLGAANKIDRLEADAAVASATEMVEKASQRYHDALSNLTYLLGIVPGAMPADISFESLKLPRSEANNPEKHYKLALQLNPQEVLLANEVERRMVESRVAKNALLPSVNLEISRGSSGLIGFDSSSSSTRNGDAANWSAFLQVTIPWTARAERAQAEQAKLQLERSEIAREDGRRQLFHDIDETIRELQSSRRQMEAAKEGVHVNQAKWNEQVQRHKDGLVSVRELREAEAELQQSSLRALTAQLAVVVADARLARLDGSILQRNGLAF